MEGVHPPPPSSFTPQRSQPTVDFFGAPCRLPTRTKFTSTGELRQHPQDNLSFGCNDGTEVGMISEWTRFRKQVIGWNEKNTAKWTYFGSDKGFLGSLKLPSISLDLPIINFHHPGQKNEGTPPMDMTVKVSSLWATEVDGVKNEGTSVGDRETSRFSNFPRYFPRKKVELVPIYTKIVPCMVIDFQTKPLSGWTFIRKKLLLPIGADTTIEQPGEEDSEVGEECVHVIPSTHRISVEERALELFDCWKNPN